MKPPYSRFLERRGYKLRRYMDAARLLPIAGLILLLVPLMLGSGGTRSLTIFVFVLWVILIGAAAFIGRVLGAEVNRYSGDEGED